MMRNAEPQLDWLDVSGLAHELANLMQVVNGNLELLDTRTTDERARRYLGNARIAAQRLTQISHDLSTQREMRRRG